MRPVLVALILSVTLAARAAAGDLRNFDDAALHAVQFVDRDEGWAVGDEGVVWHTIDGGRNWERQSTGVRASLRSLHFLNPYTGWVVGREELPQNAGSVGVLLFTEDGGLKWRRASMNTLPGLNKVRFTDNKKGYVVGDGTEQFPSGVFVTEDNGRTWRPVAGPRCPCWLAADFQDGQAGALGGAWNRMAVLRQGKMAPADVDASGGWAVTGLQLLGDRGLAVAQGGFVLLSSSGGSRWGYADLHLPAAVRAAWDLHGLHCQGDHVWAVGRPGSAVLHSKDQGKSWEVLLTRQPLPLDGVFFSDEDRGWAVGEFGSILATVDGGKTWKVQRRGGQRAGLLFVHSRALSLPVETVARLGGEDGYLAVGVRVNSSDPEAAAPARATEALRFAAAVREAGGAAGEVLWQFPMAQHQARASAADLMQGWDRLHADRAAEMLRRQLVLTLRIWRPDVVVTDPADGKALGFAADALVADAVRQAFHDADDPSIFPEQIGVLGLEPWKGSKLYNEWHERTGAQVVVDGKEVCPRLRATAQDFAAQAAGILADAPVPPAAQRYYRLCDSHLEGAEKQCALMDGIALAPGGTARRYGSAPAELSESERGAIRARRNLQAMAEVQSTNLVAPDQLLGQLGTTLKTLPEDQAGAAAFAIGSQYARLGQWTLAREVFLLLVDRYPAHPRSADAYRWLIRYQSSSEARRRHELKRFVAAGHSEFRLAQPLQLPGPQRGIKTPDGITIRNGAEQVSEQTVAVLGDPAETRQWNESCLAFGSRLQAFGPLFATDPSIQLCLQAARRNLGDFETARRWYTQFRDGQAPGPWRDAAAAELWLVDRSGPPPKPVATCRRTATLPFLDGKLDDACWRGLQPVELQNAVGETAKQYPTEAWLAYDQEYLYLALRCRHPEGLRIAPVKGRPSDADLRRYDRVSLLLDLDRDYATYFHLQVDQRGCVCDDCWGDLTWNPRWFVAVQSEATEWRIEAAIPLAELTGETITVGRAWACNVVRVLPGRGVQAWSLPADVQPRPEGMGLLLFSPEAKTAASANHRP